MPVIQHAVYIGIDPGQSGGLVALYNDRVVADAMPATERDIWDWFNPPRSPAVPVSVYAVIEKVHSMPNQGVSSTFKFGCGYGGLRMALIAAGIPFEEVTPQAWQKAMGIPRREKTESKTQWKNRLRSIAQQLFPSEKVTLKTSDALLIAEYCRRKNRGLL